MTKSTIKKELQRALRQVEKLAEAGNPLGALESVEEAVDLVIRFGAEVIDQSHETQSRQLTLF